GGCALRPHLHARRRAVSAAIELARPARAGRRGRRRARSIPGLRVTLSITLAVVTALVVLPIGALVLAAARAPWETAQRALGDPRTLSAFALSFGASLIAAAVATPIGLAIAWSLARWEIPGRRVLDALVDIPFALPTAVSGIALTALCAPTGWV